MCFASSSARIRSYAATSSLISAMANTLQVEGVGSKYIAHLLVKRFFGTNKGTKEEPMHKFQASLHSTVEDAIHKACTAHSFRFFSGLARKPGAGDRGAADGTAV